MASTASLLFNIAANSDEAESTIKSFRALMGKDLGDLGGEFEEWSKDVFGSLTTVSGALTAIGASAAAAIVAASAFVVEASEHYQGYVGEVAQAVRVTGQSAETMSVLHLAAADTQTSFESLSGGIVKFESSVVKGAEGNKVLLDSFSKLGVTQDDLKAGETELMPLLGKVMDGFHGMASGVDRAAVARALFSRNGTDLLGFLMKGSAGLAEFTKKAGDMGLILGDTDVQAFRQLQAAEEAYKAQHEALDVVIGQKTIPLWIKLKTVWAAAASAIVNTGGTGPWAYLYNFLAEYEKIGAEIKRQTAIAENAPPAPMTPPDVPQKLAKVKESYAGISTVLDALQGKIASLGGHDTQLAFEMNKYSASIEKAKDELAALEKAGKITADSAARETAALSQLPAVMTALWQQEWDKQIAANNTAAQKRVADSLAAENQLRDKLAALTETGFEGQRAALNRETQALWDSYKQRDALTAENEQLLYAIYNAGMAKIDAAEAADRDKQDAASAEEAARKQEQYDQEIARLRQHQEEIAALHMTGAQKLYADYVKEIERYPELAAQITTQYQQALQTLQNSQGWQGVFGDKFAQMLKGDEVLLKQWQQSTNQSLLMVKVTLQDLKQMSQQAFEQFAQSMGQGAVAAAIQGKSIGAAMEAAVASTLASIASQAAVQAIYATGLGFLDLAEQNYAGADAAFTSAAIFGGVAVAATVGAKALTPSTPGGGSGGSGGSGGGGGASGAGSSRAGTGGSGGSGTGQQPYVQINIAGHVVGPSGIDELTGMINDAVYNNNVQLYASANASGTKLP